MSLSHPLVVRTQMLIRRPVAEVFRAFVDPEVTTKFWFTRASGALGPGASVTWYWDMYGVSGTAEVKEFEPDRRLLIHWPTPVEWNFEPRGDAAALVIITASGFTGGEDEQVAAALDSMGGFGFVLAGCKAWLEHGVRLNLVADRHPDHPVAGT